MILRSIHEDFTLTVTLLHSSFSVFYSGSQRYCFTWTAKHLDSMEIDCTCSPVNWYCNFEFRGFSHFFFFTLILHSSPLLLNTI